MCEARTAWCTGRGEHSHHRKLRSQGGKDTPGNLLRVCHRCHAWIHAHPAASYTLGLLVHGWDDPDSVPVVAA